MMTLRHITAAKCGINRERERNSNEKEKERNPNRKRERERGISSMIGFDTATSSILTLLINHIETGKGKIEKKLSTSQ